MIPLVLYPVGIKIILPANSPDLFGIKALKVIPENVPKMALKKLIEETLLAKIFHFTDSKPQFTKLKNITKAMVAEVNGLAEISINAKPSLVSILVSLKYKNQIAQNKIKVTKILIGHEYLSSQNQMLLLNFIM